MSVSGSRDHVPNFLFHTFRWVFQRHLIFKMSKIKLEIFLPQTWVLSIFPHPSEQNHHPISYASLRNNRFKTIFSLQKSFIRLFFVLKSRKKAICVPRFKKIPVLKSYKIICIFNKMLCIFIMRILIGHYPRPVLIYMVTGNSRIYDISWILIIIGGDNLWKTLKSLSAPEYPPSSSFRI